MFFKSPQFIGSYPTVTMQPKTGLPEFAFVGRSNVGKSSLLNYLVNVKNLARVSQTPGKTQLINYFLIEEKWYLVDLPGFGYAKVPKTIRFTFQKMIADYLTKSETLQCVFLLIDSRIPPQKNDLEFTNWLGENEIPFVLVFTKADNYPSGRSKLNMEAFKTEMLKTWEELPQIFITSMKSKRGSKEIVQYVNALNAQNPQ
ncbi:MAG: ribosome biogenesis GTP-binding protein YihA/YsxC [Chitinophagales bacterium]|nr:ribosome biogenesis GTP-binding protein YihA/YsxC [Chitinophagales bacterium]